MSNVFDRFSKTINTSFDADSTPQDEKYNEEMVDATDEYPDILEIEALNSFTIPKKRRKKETFEEVTPENRSFKDIKAIIERSFKNPDKGVFSYTHCFLINNEHLLKEYSEKKRELKDSKDVQESFAFQMYTVEKQAREVCENGVSVKNSSITCLGNPDFGVYLCRHSDLLTPTGLTKGQTGHLVVFKIMKGKVKSMVEKYEGEPLEPTPNFDCHISKTSSTSDAFESSQLYIYEYNEDFDTVERPRQVLPYALVRFVLRKDQRLKSSASAKSHYVRQSSDPRSSKSKGLSQKPPAVSPVYPLLNQTLISPRPQPEIPALSSSSTVTKLPSNFLSSSVDNNNDPSLRTYKSPTIVPLISPQTTPSPLKGSLPPPDAVSKRIGQSDLDGEGTVVWTGNLTHEALPLCEVEMSSCGTPVRPSLIGYQLSIKQTVSWNKLLSLVLNNVVGLSRDKESKAGDSYYSYYRLKATPGHEEIFGTLLKYMNEKQRGAVVCMDEVRVILVPTCVITHNFKLTNSDDNLGDVMHCIFISPRSRDIQLKATVEIDEGANETSSHEDPVSTGSFTSLRDPPNPSRQLKFKAALCFPDRDFLYEGGFKAIPMSSCRLKTLLLETEFIRQVDAQDKKNIEIARAKKNRSLSTQSSGGGTLSDVGAPGCLGAKALPRQSYGLESLKNQPLFADFLASSVDTSSATRDPRVWRSASSGNVTKTSDKSHIPSSLDKSNAPFLSDMFNQYSSQKHQGDTVVPSRRPLLSDSEQMQSSTGSVSYQNLHARDSAKAGNSAQVSLPSSNLSDQKSNQNLEQSPSVVLPQTRETVMSKVPFGISNKVKPMGNTNIQTTGIIPTEGQANESAVTSAKITTTPSTPCRKITSVPTTVSPRKNLVTDLPLPPGEKVEPSNKKPSGDSRENQNPVKAKEDGTSPLFWKKADESSSSDELEDDMLNDIIKMKKPVKEILNSSGTSKGKEEDKCAIVESAKEYQPKSKEGSDASTAASQSSKTIRVVYPDTPKEETVIHRKIEISKDKEKKDDKGSKKNKKRDRSIIQDEVPSKKQRISKKKDTKVSSSSNRKRTKTDDGDSRRNSEISKSRKNESESDSDTPLLERRRRLRRKRYFESDTDGSLTGKKRRRLKTTFLDSSDLDSDSDITRSRRKLKTAEELREIYAYLIKPCFVRLERVSKREIRKWSVKNKSSCRKPSSHGDKSRHEKKSKVSNPKEKSSSHKDKRLDKDRSKQSRVIDMTRSLPTKSKVSESQSFIQDILKHESSSSKRHKNKEQEKKEKMRQLAKKVSSTMNNKSSSKDVQVQKTTPSQFASKSEDTPSAVIKKPSFDDIIDSCVSCALHRNVKPKDCKMERSKQESWAHFWNVGLHYLLPLWRIIDGKDKPPDDIEDNSSSAETESKASTEQIYAPKAPLPASIPPGARSTTSVSSGPPNTESVHNFGIIPPNQSLATVSKNISCAQSIDSISPKQVLQSNSSLINPKNPEFASMSIEEQKASILGVIYTLIRSIGITGSNTSMSDEQRKKDYEDIRKLQQRLGVINSGSLANATKRKDPELLRASSKQIVSKESSDKSRSKAEGHGHSKLTNTSHVSKSKISQNSVRKKVVKHSRSATCSSLLKQKSTSTSGSKFKKASKEITYKHAAHKMPLDLILPPEEDRRKVIITNPKSTREVSKTTAPKSQYRKKTRAWEGKYLREMTIMAKQSIREYSMLPEMTHSQFYLRFEAFKARAREITNRKPRFVGYRFKRSSLGDVEESRRLGNQEEVEEYEFSEKDVSNFDEYVKASREEEKQGKPVDGNSNLRDAEDTLKNLQEIAPNNNLNIGSSKLKSVEPTSFIAGKRTFHQ